MTILCTWTGKAFVPRPAFQKRAEQDHVAGDFYRLDIQEFESEKSRSHYFAALDETWANLPERLLEDFPTREHLRAWCLIKAGYRNECRIVTASPEDAMRACADLAKSNEYAVVVADGPIVVMYTAKSQSRKHMKKAEFQRSKQAVLGILSQLLDVEQRDLEREANQNRYERAA